VTHQQKTIDGRKIAGARHRFQNTLAPTCARIKTSLLRVAVAIATVFSRTV
jgi:hypothetical protein